ncbi:MAG: putative PEP-binding protein, partial [Candidatus Paceibacterota bacterium]
DFKTNEYSNLKGGEKFEEQEENPMLGFRGASRYIAGKEVFNMELAAIKRVRAKGYKNLHVMLPFVRTTEELSKVRELIAQSGLLSQHSFKLWIMIEIPSNVILLEDFIKVGIDGVSIGTNDLTMLLLGVDRDNPKVAHVYKETDPAVLWALDRVARVCKKHNVTVSICGQAPSDYPEIVEKLVLAGITSISVNIDAIDQVREQTYLLESLIWQKSKK